MHIFDALQAVTNGEHAFTISGNGLTMLQSGYVVDALNTNTATGRNGATILAGGLFIAKGSLFVKSKRQAKPV